MGPSGTRTARRRRSLLQGREAGRPSDRVARERPEEDGSPLQGREEGRPWDRVARERPEEGGSLL